MKNEELLKGARAFNRLNGIENTSKNVKRTKSILKDFVNMNKYDKYVTEDELLKCKNLKEMSEKYEFYYIENTKIFVDVRKRKRKENKTRYDAIGYLFIDFLEKNNINTGYTE